MSSAPTNRRPPGGGGRIAIVAAMEREIAPLVRGWGSREFQHDGRRFRLFERGEAVAIVGGIGAQAARRATEAVIEETRPRRVVSVGFAGALDPKMKIGDVIEARIVVNSGDGSRVDTGAGQGTLVSYSVVADAGQKRRLALSYAADAVDMEAAAVALAAQARGIEFGALKAISDVVDFAMPPTEKFIAPDGSFQAARFASHVAVRPSLWKRTMALARNSARASRALCGALENYLPEGDASRQREQERLVSNSVL